ncbi:hypothetical protein LTS18_006695, partial [Coniosporium uncinatum]
MLNGPAARLAKPQLGVTYFMELKWPLDSPAKVQDAADMPLAPLIRRVQTRHGFAVFCEVDVQEKALLEQWLVEQGEASPSETLFIRLSKARKALSADSFCPMLGGVTTMPQYRPTEYTPIRPAQNEFPVWYFFYGALTDPQKLSDLLALPSVDEPILRPDHVKHGTIKLLKQNYRALIDD